MNRLRLGLILVATFAACAPPPAQLLITDAALFDARSGRVMRSTTVVVRDGVIVSVVDSARSHGLRARQVIDAHGRLLVPGFIDVHHHTVDILGDTLTGGHGPVFRPNMSPDSIDAYRGLFAQAYLPYGVTAVRGAGTSDRYLPLLLRWMRSSPDAPDFYPVGGALVSYDPGRRAFAGHTVVRDSADAVAQVRAYHDLGFETMKLYWRLRPPEFEAAFHEARRLGMRVAAHVDFKVMSLPRAIDLGPLDVEHVYTLGTAAIDGNEMARILEDRVPRIYQRGERGFFWLFVLEVFNALGPQDTTMLDLVSALARHGASVTPTLHIFAQRVGLASFTSPVESPEEDTGDLDPAQLERAQAGYRMMASYVKRLYEAGVPLNLGTDCRDPGRAALSEMLLLHQAGIPMRDVLTMATLNGARALGHADRYGSLEPGKRANMILFERNPLADPLALLGPKTIIKDGRIFARLSANDLSHPKGTHGPNTLIAV